MTVANCNIKKISPTQFSAVLHYITNLHDALENLEIDLEALCAEYVKKDIVVSLLALVQSIERDPDNDFQPYCPLMKLCLILKTRASTHLQTRCSLSYC
eukprot:Pgem_evm1s6478